MATLLVNLRGVPDDEADELRELLTDHDVDYYETSAGNWGVSMPAIWLKQDDQVEEAKAVIERYQQQRYADAQAELETAKAQGRELRFIDYLKENPIRVISYLVIAAFVLYISVFPFIDFAGT